MLAEQPRCSADARRCSAMLAKLARNRSVKLPTLIWDSKEPCSIYALRVRGSEGSTKYPRQIGFLIRFNSAVYLIGPLARCFLPRSPAMLHQMAPRCSPRCSPNRKMPAMLAAMPGDARRCPAMLGDAPDPRDARPMLKHRASDPTLDRQAAIRHVLSKRAFRTYTYVYHRTRAIFQPRRVTKKSM